jgi:predicted DNA-binding transcriptional regulator AlpA
MSDSSESTMDAHPKQTYSIHEARLLLGIGEATAYRLLRRDEFPVPIIKVGRRNKISKRVLDDFLDGRAPEEKAAG